PEAFSEERIWFASPNLRLRSTLVKTTDNTSLVSFASEIRLGVPQPKSPSEG
ncbi:MAG: phycobiliprotein lyase, partial [Synechococcales cyanobacterium]